MNYRAILKYYWQFLVRYKWMQIGLFGAYAVAKIGETAVLPVIYKRIIDTVSMPPADPEPILLSAVVYLAVTFVVINVFFRTADYWVTISQSAILRDVTDYALKKLQEHSYTFFTNSFAGGLVAKSKRFVSAFETLHDEAIFSIWIGGITLISSAAVLFYYSPVLGGLFTLWLITYIGMVSIFIRQQIPKNIALASTDTKVTGHLSDIISNFFTIKMFGSRRWEEAAFAKTTDLQEKRRRASWIQKNFWHATWQSIHIDTFSVLFIAGAVWLWIEGVVTAGTIVLIQIYVFTSLTVVWNLSRNIIRINAALADADEMIKIFEQKIDVPDPQDPEAIRIHAGKIVFENVTFSYEGHGRVFDALNLTIQEGEKVALVGHSGAGKTTITKLLLRFLDIDSGIITIDGQRIDAVLQDELRKRIAYVPQEPLLFHRSIRDNIAYAKQDASLEEVVEVAKKAHAHGFIEKLPKGYDTLVGERGVKLSGGERQRIAIARAMLKDAPIIMLDEATSALDSISEREIQKAFTELIEGKTTIVIAHRLSTIQQMDRIVVFDSGKIVEEGTHRSLLRKKGVYGELWQSQVGGFIVE